MSQLPDNDHEVVVACLGSSSTAARGPYDWILDLERRAQNRDVRFTRFAEGGDLAYNGARRLPKLLGTKPDVVLIMLGGNDVMASMPQQSAYYRAMLKLTKHLPRAPSVEWFREVMTSIVACLQRASSAKIGIISLPPWGENLDSCDAYQAELNRRFDEHNAVLRALADEHHIAYIPFYERFCDLLRASPGQSFQSFKILPFYRDIFRQLVLRKSNDEIGALNGWKFHRDGIHLNSASGKLLADLVQEFLNTTRHGSAEHRGPR